MTSRDATTDFQSDWSAYQRGDFVTAVHEFQPLVEQGNVDAQFNPAFLYENGLGVANYHHATIQALVELLNILGLRGLDEVRPRHINRRINQEVVMSYEQIYPCIPDGCLLDAAAVPDDWKQNWETARAAAWR